MGQSEFKRHPWIYVCIRCEIIIKDDNVNTGKSSEASGDECGFNASSLGKIQNLKQTRVSLLTE